MVILMDTVIEIENIWQDFGLDRLQEGIRTLFPDYSISLKDFMGRILEGDILGIFSGVGQALFGGVMSQISGMRNVFIWLLVIGIVSAVLTHFVSIFDRHQIADLSFYFMYLLVTAVILKCFGQAADVAKESIQNILLFVKMLIPTYLMSVGLATGSITAGGYYQIILLLIFGVENILMAGVMPFVYSYCMLAVVNGVWAEEKLALIMELLGKGIRLVLKASVGVVTGISVFQSVITPALDSVKASFLQKTISAIPGIGDAADGVVNLIIGSAVVIKNSVGVVLLFLLLILCVAPLIRVFLLACLLKLSAALMGIVSDSRLTSVTNRVGEGGMLLFGTMGTALLLFLITITVMAAATNRGI